MDLERERIERERIERDNCKRVARWYGRRVGRQIILAYASSERLPNASTPEENIRRAIEMMIYEAPAMSRTGKEVVTYRISPDNPDRGEESINELLLRLLSKRNIYT